ncbi:DNA-directed RNA polymerase beta subunit [Levilactobacillus brevis]|nr:DNA-directed RNA polymerase beta subunit [Levilactobacillus brevis]
MWWMLTKRSPCLTGSVAGVADDQIMVQLPAGNYRQLALTAIRCVTVAAQ